MDTIKCPVCGDVNPADNEFCQNCQSRLEPLTGALKSENAPLQPGQNPTKKVTAELEPILPQWLRKARQQARETEGEEKTKLAAKESSSNIPVSHGPDLLAGLASQKDEDEDAPDWLVNITGNAPAKKKKVEPEETNTKRMKVDSLSDFFDAPADAARNVSPSTPIWMKPQETAPEKDELAEWLSQLEQSPASFAVEKEASTPPAQPVPEASSGADTSDWLHNLQNDSTFEDAPSDQSAVLTETSDWLKNLDVPAASSTPATPTPQLAQNAPAPSNNTPDWLKDFDANAVSFEQPLLNKEPIPSSDAPDWTKTFRDTPKTSTAVVDSSVSTDQPSNGMMPDWLQAAVPSSNVPPAIQSEPVDKGVPPSVEIPDWLNSFKPIEARPQETASSAMVSDKPPIGQVPVNAPAFESNSLSSSDVDAIFGSIQMPDWLSSAVLSDKQSVLENLPPAAQAGESLAPAELPSWVQAMRPVESALSGVGLGESASVETNGPLAGLQGILPTVPGAGKPSSRPKSHAIKLDASEEQQAHSVLLEEILAEETSPVPIKFPTTILSQKMLRWGITALLFLSIGGIFFSRTQIFSLPSRLPVPNDETESAISTMDAIPQDALVLAVFDYEPSLAGELEATASPLFNRLLLLKHPNLVIVSTSPTGAALAERFMSTTMAERAYQRNVQYVDLGYLAGGLAGVHDFAQNPAAVMPIGVDGNSIWQSAILQGKTRLSDFAAVIVLTDSAEAGRVWVEQAGPLRGNASFIVISSAQAAPMLMPYFQSAQITGLVSGLNSAAKIEQANGQPGLVRRYWDSYSIGLLLAAAIILLGGFWDFIVGLQASRAREAK